MVVFLNYNRIIVLLIIIILVAGLAVLAFSGHSVSKEDSVVKILNNNTLNVNDSIKIKVLYNDFMTLRDTFSNSQRRLRAEIDVLQDKNKKLEDEIASIKQALYFG